MIAWLSPPNITTVFAFGLLNSVIIALNSRDLKDVLKLLAKSAQKYDLKLGFAVAGSP